MSLPPGKQLCSLSLPSLPFLAFPLVQLLSQPSVPPLPTHSLLSGKLQMAAALLQQVEQVEQDGGVTEQVPLQYKVSGCVLYSIKILAHSLP